MGYKWEQHRQTCYRLYVEEKKSLDELVAYMREHHGFGPRYVLQFLMSQLYFLLFPSP
jgi:hypothetical protein